MKEDMEKVDVVDHIKRNSLWLTPVGCARIHLLTSRDHLRINCGLSLQGINRIVELIEHYPLGKHGSLRIGEELSAKGVS